MKSTRSGMRPTPFARWTFSILASCAATLAIIHWLGPSRLAVSSAADRADAVLTTMATLSGAAVVLALTATLVGFQMSSRFGTRRAEW